MADTVRIELDLPRWCIEALERWNPAECEPTIAARAAYIVQDYTERYVDDELAAMAARLLSTQLQ